MMNSIDRYGQASVDWNQLQGVKKQASEYDTQFSKDKGNQSTIDKSKLNKEIENVNAQLEALNHSLRMKFSEEAEQFYVEVIDVRTHEVLDSIPSKHMIELAAKLKDMIGFFVDEKR